MVFHVVNRGNDRREIFDDGAGYEAFLRVIKETQQRVPMRVLAYGLLPTTGTFCCGRPTTATGSLHAAAWVNQPQTKAELEAVRLSVSRGQPFGEVQDVNGIGLIDTRDDVRPDGACLGSSEWLRAESRSAGHKARTRTGSAWDRF